MSLEYNMAKSGWVLLEDTNEGLELDSLRNLDFVSFLKHGEQHINGNEVVRRARAEIAANFGQCYAEYLFHHPEHISIDFAGLNFLFTGTIWQDCPYGYRRIPCLRWLDGWWELDFAQLHKIYDGCWKLFACCK